MQSSTQRSGFENVRARKPDEAWHQTALWFLNPLDPHNEPSWETATDDGMEGMTDLDAESGTFGNTSSMKVIARSFSTFVTQLLARRAAYPDQWPNLMIYDKTSKSSGKAISMQTPPATSLQSRDIGPSIRTTLEYDKWYKQPPGRKCNKLNPFFLPLRPPYINYLLPFPSHLTL